MLPVANGPYAAMQSNGKQNGAGLQPLQHNPLLRAP
jgi:hypothetical protein